MHVIEPIEALLADTFFGIFNLSEQGWPRKRLDLSLKNDKEIRPKCKGKVR